MVPGSGWGSVLDPSLTQQDRLCVPDWEAASELGEMVSGNVRVMSEMLTELVPTQTEPAT